MVQAKKLINPFGAIKTPFQVVALLQNLHTQKGLKLNRGFASYLRQAEVFLVTHGPEKAERILLLSAMYSRHSWGFIFLGKLADEEQLKDEKEEEKELSPLCQVINECYG